MHLFDEATKKEILEMGKTGPTHVSKIVASKWVSGDDNMIITGGWDDTLQIWDIRERESVRTIFGPHLCGDAIDYRDNVILTGSWRSEKQLQTWSISTGELIETID